MSERDGQTVSLWLSNSDKDKIDRFLEERDMSRSELLREGALLYMSVETAMEGLDLDFTHEQEKRSYTRQALIDLNQREQLE